MAQSRQPFLNLPQPVAWLVAATFVLHVVRILLPDDLDFYVIRRFGFVPTRFLSWWSDTPGPLGLGTESQSWVDAVAPFFTHIFIHGDFVHLGLNLLWLMPFGAAIATRLRPSFGWRTRFLVFYLVTGAAGALTHLIVYPDLDIPLVGASGAVSGLMGGATRFIFATGGLYGLMESPHSPLTDRRVVMFAAAFTLVNVMLGVIGLGLAAEGAVIAWHAHIGGFVAGLLLIGWFDGPPPSRLRRMPFDQPTALRDRFPPLKRSALRTASCRRG